MTVHNTLMKILIGIITSVIIFSMLSVSTARWTDTVVYSAENLERSTLYITVSCNDSIKGMETKTWLLFEGAIETSIEADVSSKIASSKLTLPVDSGYSMSVIVPAGFVVESVSMAGYEIKPSGNRYSLNISGGHNYELTIDLMRNSQAGVFYANDILKNTISAGSWNPPETEVALSAYSVPQQRNAQDMLLLVDKSGSLNQGLDGGTANSTDNPSRISQLKESLIDMLDTLSTDPNENSRVSIVTFDTTSDVLQDWITVGELKSGNNLDQLKNKVQNIQPGGGTMAELGFHTAGEQFNQSGVTNSSNDRYLIFFTDGIAGYGDLYPYPQSPIIGADGNQYNFFNNLAPQYRLNNFRVMAELLNQSAVLKGARGQQITVNETVRGYGSASDNGTWIDYYGIYCGGANADEMNYNWQNYIGYEGTYSTYIVREGERYSGVGAGNFKRTAVGQGVTVYSLGIFVNDNYTGYIPEIVDTQIHRLVSASESGEDNFFMIDRKDTLSVNYKKLFGRVSGVYSDLIMRYYFDETDFEAVDADGGTVTVDEEGRNCIEWEGIELTPGMTFEKKVKLEIKSAGATPGGEVSVGYKKDEAFAPIERNFIEMKVN